MKISSILVFLALTLLITYIRADLIEADDDEAFFWSKNGNNCEAPEVAYELECRRQCPQNFWPQSGFCVRDLTPSNAPAEPAQPQCDMNTVSMFMSWMVYSHKEWIGSTIDTKNYPQWFPRNCGTWRVINAMHYQNNVNSHVMMAVNEPSRKMVVAWRGSEGALDRFSESLSDWLVTNARFFKEYSPFGGGSAQAKIHKGFLNSYLVLSSQVNAQIYQYLSAGYEIYITGHSKGAATATVHGFALAAGFTQAGIRDQLDQIKMITFASPRVGDGKFVEYFDQAFKTSRRFVSRFWHTRKQKYVTDVVPHVPPSMFGFEHVKGLTYLPCHDKSFQNPHTPSQWLPAEAKQSPRLTLGAAVQCHFQEVYLLPLKP